jgi:hypothetical protein
MPCRHRQGNSHFAKQCRADGGRSKTDLHVALNTGRRRQSLKRELQPAVRMLDAYLRLRATRADAAREKADSWIRDADQKTAVTLLPTMEVGVIGAILKTEDLEPPKRPGLFRVLGVPQREGPRYPILQGLSYGGTQPQTLPLPPMQTSRNITGSIIRCSVLAIARPD